MSESTLPNNKTHTHARTQMKHLNGERARSSTLSLSQLRREEEAEQNFNQQPPPRFQYCETQKFKSNESLQKQTIYITYTVSLCVCVCESVTCVCVCMYKHTYFVVIFRKGTNNGYEMVASRRIEIVIVRLTENDGRRNETSSSSSFICTKVNTRI